MVIVRLKRANIRSYSFMSLAKCEPNLSSRDEQLLRHSLHYGRYCVGRFTWSKLFYICHLRVLTCIALALPIDGLACKPLTTW